MLLKLRFTYDSYIIHIPDGFVGDLKKLQFDFLDWMYEQPDCKIFFPSGDYVCTYGPEDFVRYLNEVVLKDVNEVAYLSDKPYRGKLPTICY